MLTGSRATPDGLTKWITWVLLGLVDVLHAHQSGAGRLGGGEHAGLQRGELLRPSVVGRVESLVDDASAVGDGGAEARISGVAADDLDTVGHGRGPGAVDHANRFAAPA